MISREIYITVRKGFGNKNHYFLDEHVTVLTKDDVVLKGKILTILSKGFQLEEEQKGVITLLYLDVENIVNSDWLYDEDIRNF